MPRRTRILAAIILATLAAAPLPPATQPWSAGPLELVMAGDAQRLLGVPSDDAEDLIEAWSFVIEQRRADADVTRSSAAMDNLVDAVVAGGRAEALPRLLLGRMSLDDDEGDVADDPDWTLGSAAERADVVRYVWRFSSSLASDPARVEEAAKWARAALLLAAQLGPRRGPDAALTVVRNFKRFGDLARLQPDQLATVQAWSRGLVASTDRFDAKDVAAMRAIDALMAEPSAATAAATMDALKALHESADPSRLWHAYESFALARAARDQIYARGDAGERRRIDAMLAEWRASAMPEARRWADEALAPPRPPRTTPLVDEIEREDVRFRLLAK